MDSETKEWVSVKRRRGGGTDVTVTLKEGRFSASWSALTDMNKVGQAVRDCRRYATDALEQAKEAAA